MNDRPNRTSKPVQLLLASLLIVIAGIAGFILFGGRSKLGNGPEEGVTPSTEGAGGTTVNVPAPGASVASSNGAAAGEIPALPLVPPGQRVPPSSLLKEPTGQIPLQEQDPHVMAMSLDAQKRLWVATEGEGIWCMDRTAATPWKGYGIEDGLPEDFGYALACDKLGRIWVGHLNHGVSVFNGKAWKNYGTLQGPIGEHVFAIATSPIDGDVWIGTSAGLTRYSLKDDRWHSFTRADGLPGDQISALAIDAAGTLFAGTLNNGIAIAHAEDAYAKWTQVDGPPSDPLTATGSGLPSPQINALAAAPDGTIYAATSAGLAIGTNHGNAWTFIRGKDYADKITRRAGGPPPGWTAPPRAQTNDLFAEDFLTAVAIDETGHLLVGTREHGYDVYDPAAHAHNLGTAQQPGRGATYIRSLLCNSGGAYVGLAGGGMYEITPASGNAAASAVAPFPRPAAVPTAAEILALTQKLLQPATAPETASPIALLDPDWLTEGSWVGRYGRHQMSHPEFNQENPSNNNIRWGVGASRLQFFCSQGRSNTLTFWTSSNYLADPRAMEINPVYLATRIGEGKTTPDVDRRQSEWNDAGNNVPRGSDGPNLYADLQVPEGTYEISFYHDNDNGNRSRNRYRDFTFSARLYPPAAPFRERTGFAQWPEITRSRVSDFWGGVYTRFLVKGPTSICILIGRNHSYNTTLNGSFLDTIEEYPEPYFGPLPGAAMANEPVAPPLVSDADKLMAALEAAHRSNPARYAANYRAAYTELAKWFSSSLSAADKPRSPAETLGLQRQLATCCYRLGLFQPWETLQQDMKLHTARDIEKALKSDLPAPVPTEMNRQLVITYRKTLPP